MGGVISSDTQIAENVPLQRFTGSDPITDIDPFWNNLLSFNLKIDDYNTTEARAFDESLNDLLQSLMYNTQRSGNFAAFIKVFLRRSTELKTSEQYENKIFLWQTANALIILRYICKFLTQRMTEIEFVKVFATSASPASSSAGSEEELEAENDADSDSQYSNTAEKLIDILIDILADLAVNENTMAIHVEAVKCLITLLSSQLYNDAVANTSVIFSYFINGACSKQAAILTRTLLRNYLVHNSEYHPLKKSDGGSIVLGIASSFWSIVQAATGAEDESDGEQDYPVTLGNLSILLLLNLACHHPAKGCNPFKETLALFQNSQEVSSLATDKVTFKLDYNSLYERLCCTACQEPPMLLLYLLLHRNSGFRNFILSRINLENLVLPVVKILHKGVTSLSSNSHHMYLALIVMLILSEDDFFCKIIHETTIRDVDWLEIDRPMREISLGGICVMVFVRTIHKNAIRMRDRYLHTNCLAALANMSAYFKNLCPVVCQKMIALLELLTKRHGKLVEQMRLNSERESTDGESHTYHDDVTALEEGIRTLLEIINSALCGNLRNNPHLIYTLLYHRNLFDTYQHHPMFQDLLANITLVISHFSSKVVNVRAGDGNAMMEIIEKEALVLPTDRLAKFPELRFRYVEDENTVEFFVPYVWRLTIQHSTIPFESARVKLFNARVINAAS
ncbi:Dymeclin [Trichostrongylus colubriformis]|uniref:Dymeclin n=1 Tax=Trichostrongylus colubriformis TaxID=6319 RepID=A0AAN8IB74_TRICO